MWRVFMNLFRKPPIGMGLGRDSRSRNRNTQFASFLSQTNRRRVDSDFQDRLLQGRKFARLVIIVAVGAGSIWFVMESAKALSVF